MPIAVQTGEFFPRGSRPNGRVFLRLGWFDDVGPAWPQSCGSV